MIEEIEPQGHIKVSEKHKVARIREEILKEVKTFDIPFVADAKTVLLYDPNATPKDILESLAILRKDLILRIREKKEVIGAKQVEPNSVA